MAWVGFASLITIYWCCFLAVATSRISWALLSGWLIPIFAMAVNYQAGMEINGLMFLICMLMFFFCRRGVSDVRMWNVKLRKKHSVLFGMLYFFTLLLLFYSFAQAQIQGYILNLQGWGAETSNFLRMFVSTVPLYGLNLFYTNMLYNAIDRVYCRKQKLTLLGCNFFMANESGVGKGYRQGYFLEGIQNGVTYYFRMTQRTFYMLRKEPILRLETEIGLFGGMYVVEIDRPDLLKRTRKRDRTYMKWGSFLALLTTVFGVWLFWFR